MSLTESAEIPLGTPAHGFTLVGIDDRHHTLDEYAGARLLVMIFMCNHCTYVQAIWDDLVTLETVFRSRGVQFLGINANDASTYPEDSFENMKKYARQKRQDFPYLWDEKQEVARQYGATCTPDIFVYDEKRLLAYHGRFDNTAGLLHGGQRTSADLAEAIELLLRGEKLSPSQKPSIGCNIKWKD